MNVEIVLTFEVLETIHEKIQNMRVCWVVVLMSFGR